MIVLLWSYVFVWVLISDLWSAGSQRLFDKKAINQKSYCLMKSQLYIPSSSGKCPLGFNLSSFGLTSSGYVAEDENDADVEGVVEEEDGWWWEGWTLWRLISLRTSLMVFLSSLSRLLREGLDFIAQVRSNFSRSCCSCLSRGRCSRLAGTSRQSTKEKLT